MPSLRVGPLAALLFLAAACHAFATPAVGWRAPDGTLITPAEEVEVGPGSALVRPGAKGGPVFVIPFPVSLGEVISVRLQVEAVRAADDAGAEGQAGVVLTALPAGSRHNNNPDAEHRQIVIVGSERESIRFAFRARAAHEAGQLLLVPTLSFFGRPIRLSEVVFAAHGPDADPQALTAAGVSYRGQEPDAAWRAEAAARIDRHRKGPLRLVALDRLGRPLPGVSVSVEQLRHAYPFGTAVVSSRLVDAPRVFAPDSGTTTELWLADNARYREEILRNFNAIVTENDLKWPQWNGSNERPENFRQSWTLAALDWARQHEIAVKGHTLVWGSWRFSPPWLREHEADPDTVHAAALAHIRDIGHATADRTRWWDVLNEPMSHRNLIELLGPARVAEWFKEARAALPNTRLVMNEFDLVGNGGNPKRRANFLAFARELRAHGAPLDVLGLQGHFWSERFTAPEDVWRIADELHEASGLPLMISEFDTNIPNERLQADYTRDFLTAWFAHPATEAFIMWGFWARAHWMGEAGSMFRADWTPKPNLAAYRDLVFRDWWTRASSTTGSDGAVELRAFLGRHRVTFTAADGRSVTREVDLAREGRELHAIIP
jgi:GH35 family endo-1,4-beta-xylanase